jgi:hypothetical protein
MHRFLSLITLFLLLSCSSEKPAEVGSLKTPDEDVVKKTITARAPDTPATALYSLEINPSEASRNSTFSIKPVGFNLTDAKIEWSVNKKPVTSPVSHRFKAIDAKKGDDVQAMATVHGKEIFSNTIKIKNAPPEISKIKVLPEVFKPGDTLSVDVTGSDIDEDEVTIIYAWTNNDKPAGDERQIATPLKRGDNVTVKITPFDGESYGRTVTMNREIRNMPPMITHETQLNFDGKVYTYTVKAADPDEDTLSFSLKTAPDGMTINQATGHVEWNVPEDFMKKIPITVSVTDGKGGVATKDYFLEIKPEIKKETHSAKTGP